MMEFNEKYWIRWSLLSFLIVSLFGATMRYKIGFEFPYFDQKNLQHAHSHFAFSGWITQTLWVFLVLLIKNNLSGNRIKTYNTILLANLICSYGMLVSFTIQGYDIFSITCSSLSIILSIVFVFSYLQDIKFINPQAGNYIKAALCFNIISALGTAALCYMMATKQISQHYYLSSVYWYLHFQYNGWFLFASIGLFIAYVKHIMPNYNHSKNIFYLWVFSCLPAFGLSVLWLHIPLWLYIIIIAASVAQLIAWVIFLVELKKHAFINKQNFFNTSNLIFIIIGIAITIKLLLQLGSTIPEVSKLAFGFRPIVIAYLHLVFLLIISLFLVNYLIIKKLIILNTYTIIGLILFITGIILNEVVLTVQGIASFSYTIIPYVNTMLFIVSVLIFSGLLVLFTSLKKK